MKLVFQWGLVRTTWSLFHICYPIFVGIYHDIFIDKANPFPKFLENPSATLPVIQTKEIMNEQPKNKLILSASLLCEG